MTAAPETIEYLSRVALFARLEEDSLEALAALSEVRTYDAGELIVERDTPNDGLIVVVEGELEARRGDRVINQLGPGDWIGDMSLIDGQPHSVDVFAITAVEALFLAGEQFRVVVKHDPEVAMCVMEVLVARLRETLDWLDAADEAK